MLEITREQWLNTAAATMITEIIKPVLDVALPAIRYSITAPPMRASKTRVLGTCWNRAASDDDTNEIFITAMLGSEDSPRILDVTLHEQMHALLNNEDGHKGQFVKYCRLVGLEGTPKGNIKESFTATRPTPALDAKLKEIIKTLGPIPHGKMDAALSGKTTQKNRQKLMYCDTCEFKFRASQKAINMINVFDCPVCGHGTLKEEVK